MQKKEKSRRELALHYLKKKNMKNDGCFVCHKTGCELWSDHTKASFNNTEMKRRSKINNIRDDNSDSDLKS